MHGYKWPINCTRTRTAAVAVDHGEHSGGSNGKRNKQGGKRQRAMKQKQKQSGLQPADRKHSAGLIRAIFTGEGTLGIKFRRDSRPPGEL